MVGYGIISAILEINPAAKVSINAEDLDQITWHDGTAVIPKADIQAKMDELKTAYDALAYSRSRKEEYDKLNQFELMYDDKQNSTDNWTKEIKAIKKKYPKN